MTDENSTGRQLRDALREANREHDAVKEMFKQDTGADSACINRDNEKSITEVTLIFYDEGVLA